MKNIIKKITLGFMGAFIVLVAANKDAKAVTSQVLDIHVSINATKSLSVGTTFYNYGALAVNTSSVSATALVVTNNSSGLIETYRMVAGNATSDAGGTNWTLAASTGSADQYAIDAIFATTAPTNVDANWSSDALSAVVTTCSATQFGNGTLAEAGASVNPSATRNLWFRIHTPTTLSDTGAHTAQVTLSIL